MSMAVRVLRRARSTPQVWVATSGLLHMIAGMLVGAWLYRLDIQVLRLIRTGIHVQDTGYLLVGGGAIALLNTVRVLPIYLGAYRLMEAFTTKEGSRTQRALGYAVAALAVPFSYTIIRKLFGIPYDFGVPAAAPLAAMIGVHAVIQKKHGFITQTIILGLFILGLQWVSLSPLFDRFGFGRGELTQELKLAVTFLDRSLLLDAVSIAVGLLFLAIAYVMGKAMVDFDQYKVVTEAHRKQQEAMQEARIRELQGRTAEEMQALVHDLKTPLTAIRGLVGLLDFDDLKPSERRQHVERIDQAVERMSQMISEILYRQPQRVIAGDDLLRYMSAHLSEYSQKVKVDIGSNLPQVRVNAVRLTRAVANLVQNALEATSGDDAPVMVRARRVAGDLRIVVRDWGRGIDPGVMERLWQPGVSTKGSSGMGLHFVRQVVVDDHGGEVAMYGKTGRGTLVRITLRGC